MVVFFFKQKTAYEMRISDLSSDLCSSDLAGLAQWQKRVAFFKRVIDEFDTITRDDPAWLSRQFLKSQGVDRVAARLLLDAMSDLDPALLAKVAMPTLV